MKSKPPADRRKFGGEWDEINYLYDKLLYWLYEREDAARARPYADRLAQLLPKADPKHEGIFSEECWSLLYEANADLPKAIQHRENEIRKMRQLHEIARSSPRQALVFKCAGYGDLSDRLDLLATLYHASGQLDKAIATVLESKRLCKQHRIPFDGEDMLEEYQEEKQATANGTPGNGRNKHRAAKVATQRSE